MTNTRVIVVDRVQGTSVAKYHGTLELLYIYFIFIVQEIKEK